MKKNEISTDEVLNFRGYKQAHEDYNKLIKSILKQISTERLTDELKKRKILKFNWITNKYDEVKE